MILIDALYINDGGGKVLLDYLIQELESTDKNIFYLLDERIVDKIPMIKETNIVYIIKADFYLRKKFYLQHRNQFSTVLCFGNLPPNIKLKSKVYTYFHQLLYLKVPADMKVFQKLMYLLKTRILRSVRNNTDHWVVQTDLVKEGLHTKYKIDKCKILILPFYQPLPEIDGVIRKKNRYIYVSNANQHKNHVKLLEAFCIFYDRNKVGELILTVDLSLIHI